jgi:predicted PurR-regulated permease PerM
MGQGGSRMKFEWNRRDSTIAAYALIVLVLAISFYSALNNLPTVAMVLGKIFRPIAPIFYGFAVAYLLNPLMVVLETRLLSRLARYQRLSLRRRRAISLVLTYLLTALVLVTFFLLVFPQVVQSVTNMASQLQSYVAAAERMAYDLLGSIPDGVLPQELIDRLTEMAGGAMQQVIAWLSSSVPVLLGLVLQFGSGVIAAFVAIIVSAYLLYAKERFMAQVRKILCAFLPRRKVYRLMSVTRTTHMMFGGFITGKILDSIIIGILCFIGLSIMRMPNIMLVSFIVGVTNVIPYFGPFIGAIPSFFIIAIASPMQGLLFLVFILVLQQLDGNVIGPMILGDSVGLSAFWVVFSILLFGGVFGVFGMFIGVPTFGVIYWLIKQEISRRLTEKKLPTDTSCYLKPLNENDADGTDQAV